MCRLFTPISQEASYNTVQLPGGFEDKLVKPAPLLTYNWAPVDDFIGYQISKLRIETVLNIKLAPASLPELK